MDYKIYKLLYPKYDKISLNNVNSSENTYNIRKRKRFDFHAPHIKRRKTYHFQILNLVES
jgi:hypothetical protein